ncbi:hypothetical protein I588_04542 [Enterococcus pallens ATCC BAA-351]|uniref:Uncharacterized protein n=1 Tax=Enterococcus pallens ATCC BAA-351 TaxID=1158607 RepID=R2T3G6_9ENTE|nr:hypothetical protein UAU_01711 [Enterococcus pallens ATCC BAA-351]EOU14892.1 hypothetical protein I588_04542 [Enterococcus pallens ATCC BAA-351]
MTKIYANLIGTWCCLNDDENCYIGENRVSPSQWWEESAIIHSPQNRETYDSFYQLDYVHIHYKSVDYRINPIFIQVVIK